MEFYSILLKCVTPLVSVLRLVDDDSKLAISYIYEAMNRDRANSYKF